MAPKGHTVFAAQDRIFLSNGGVGSFILIQSRVPYFNHYFADVHTRIRQSQKRILETTNIVVFLDEETVAKARLDSGFDRIRESLEFQDFIKFKLQEINGVVHRNDSGIKRQNG